MFLSSLKRTLFVTIQTIKFLRLLQFIVSVEIINERLEQLDYQIISTCRQLEQYGTRSSIFSSFTSTRVYLTFESHREMYAKIWNLYTIVNEYFGLSILFNMINIFIAGAFNIYSTIVSHSSHISTMIFVDPFENVSHACILIVVMIDTCRKSDKIVRVIAN